MTRGKPFESGNKFGRGRPKGSRNMRTLEAQALLDEYKEPIIKRCIARALDGDPRAIQLCMERILAPQRDAGVRLRLPKLAKLKDIELATQRLLEEVSKGNITPQEAERIYPILADVRNYQQADEFAARIIALEKKAVD
jgi:hypothetical protein